MRHFTTVIPVATVAFVTGCAAPAPVSFPGGARASVIMPPPSQTTPATQQQTKFEIPEGYKLYNLNGQKLYCMTEIYTGTCLGKFKHCLTEAQIQEHRGNTEDLMQHLQLGGATATHCATGLAVC